MNTRTKFKLVTRRWGLDGMMPVYIPTNEFYWFKQVLQTYNLKHGWITIGKISDEY